MLAARFVLNSRGNLRINFGKRTVHGSIFHEDLPVSDCNSPSQFRPLALHFGVKATQLEDSDRLGKQACPPRTTARQETPEQPYAAIASMPAQSNAIAALSSICVSCPSKTRASQSPRACQ